MLSIFSHGFKITIVINYDETSLILCRHIEQLLKAGCTAFQCRL